MTGIKIGKVYRYSDQGVLLKRCPSCEKWKDTSYFHRRKLKHFDGWRPYCKICENEKAFKERKEKRKTALEKLRKSYSDKLEDHK